MNKNQIKLLTVALAMSFFTTNLFSQGPYLSFNVGYGFKMGSSTSIMSNTTRTATTFTQEKVKVSLGKGFNLGGTFGYMFGENGNLGAELGLSYLIGGKSKATATYTGGKTDYTISANMFRINPSIILASGLEKFNPYAKLGLVIGIGSVKSETDNNNNGNVSYHKTKTKGGVAIGLSSAVGAMFDFNESLSFFGEVNMVNMQYTPTKSELVEATNNGRDLLPNMTTSQKETEYVNSYTIDQNNPAPSSQPDQQLKSPLPFSSIGINIGVRLTL